MKNQLNNDWIVIIPAGLITLMIIAMDFIR